jgi:multidrug efflux pump subunit AcrA (membrane-fusion protein)
VGIARKWVLPIAWIVVFAVIAAALVKIAFFPDQSEAVGTEFPSAELVEPQYPVSLGTVRNDVTLTGTVEADDAVPVPATLTGEVREVLVGQGQAVTAGQEILKLRAQVMNSDGSMGTDWDVVTAPASGVLSQFTALVGQSFAVGDAVGKIAPPSFHVSGSIPPEQLYRLLERPTEAEVTINGGPAPFTCTGLSISSPVAGQGATGTGTGAGTGDGGPVVRCAVPGDVTVFPGLTAKIVIAGGIAENVLVVPTTAVEGAAGTGNVYFVLPDGSTELRPVSLGLSDGVNVEVTEGLKEGDVILQFVPGAPSVPGEGLPGGVPAGENCRPTPDGGMVCGG